MNRGSLRLRLALAASIAISLALATAGFAFYFQFQKHIERLTLIEFNTHFEQLASLLTFDEKNELVVDGELSDPRFSKQFGGLYWQIDVPGSAPIRSRSLWDETLSVPTPPSETEEEHIHALTGPNDTTILSLEKLITIDNPAGQRKQFVVTIGIDNKSVSNALTGFSEDITSGLGLLYLVLLGSSLGLIFFGLKPLEAIRQGMEAIRAGKQPRMSGTFPSEVQPLVSELNSLLDARENQLARARQRAGNLAHGLKTPLTVLDAIASGIGKEEEASEIREATNDMRLLIERELTRARVSAASPNRTTLVLPVVTRLAKAMQHARTATPLNWQIEIEEIASLPIDAGDAMELIGNLLDNAQKHASSQVRISVLDMTLTVEDDGPGVEPGDYDAIIKRGVKLDERKVGSGLGLAIVQELVEAYNATMQLDRSKLGGLAVKVHFIRV